MKNKNFTVSEIIDKAKEEFKQEVDSVLAFVREFNYQPSTSNHVAFSTIRDNYLQFIGKGSFPVSEKRFSKDLVDMGFKKIVHFNVRGFLIETASIEAPKPLEPLPF